MLEKIHLVTEKLVREKLEKKACVLSVIIFLLNQMNCEVIPEGKLGEEDFAHLNNIT